MNVLSWIIKLMEMDLRMFSPELVFLEILREHYHVEHSTATTSA